MVDFPIYFGGAVLLCVLYFFILSERNKREQQIKQLADLTERFGSVIAQNIIDGLVWQGMTVEMLREAKGEPDDADRNVFKTKTKETWKYGRIGKNLFSFRVMIEDGLVVGWKN